jgi:hypothetical protein
MSLQRIVFLDFDGVLLNRSSWAVHSGANSQADPACVAALNRITSTLGASIVVSSSWRLGNQLIQLKEQLRSWGVQAQVLGKTPFHGFSRRVTKDGATGLTVGRGYEIEAWLKEYEAMRQRVEFVVLDDDADTVPVQHRHVITNGELGLTEADADRAIQMFNAEVKGAGA